MKISEHIDIEELVPKDTFMLKGIECFDLIDYRIPLILERIRELCGNRPLIINNWLWGGKYQYRGYRPLDCTVGARNSMHKHGMAVDFDVRFQTAEETRKIILENESELMLLGLTRMERDVSWVHIDLKSTGLKHIKLFRP